MLTSSFCGDFFSLLEGVVAVCQVLRSGYVPLWHRSHPLATVRKWQADARRRNHRTFKDADVTRLKVFLLSAEGDQETLRGEGEK